MTDSRRFSRATLILIVAALVVYLIGNADVPLWDRDEPRYAQCSRQMLETGDWVLPRFLGDLRLAKPPLIYWLQAASMRVLGITEFAARLPSAIGMILTLALMAYAVGRAMSREHAFWAVLVMASSAMTIVSAKACCLTDAVLLLFITLAQLCLYRTWTGKGGWLDICVAGIAIGLGLLTKGPVILGILATTFIGYAVLTWTLRWKKPSGDGAPMSGGHGPAHTPAHGGVAAVAQATGSGVPQPMAPDSRRGGGLLQIAARVLVAALLAIAVCAPWIILVEQRWAALPPDVRAEAAARGSERKRAAHPNALQSAGEHGYIWTVIEKEVIHRSKVAQEGHWGPPGYYLAAIWGIYLPWSLVLPATLVIAWRRRHLVHVRFLLGAALGPWVMFELIQTKLPHYILPCLVPLSILTADAIVQCLRHGIAAFSDRSFRRGVVVWGVIIGVLGAVPWLSALWFTPHPLPMLILVSLVAIGYAFYVVRTFRSGRTERALLAMGLGALLLYAIVFRALLPSADYLLLARKTANALIANGATKPGDVLMLDYKEPSVAFYQGGSIREHSASIITAKLLEKTTPVRWYVITREVWNASGPKSPADPDPRKKLKVVATFHGLNVADGMRAVEVMIVRRK